jgi:hypothetical protein
MINEMLHVLYSSDFWDIFFYLLPIIVLVVIANVYIEHRYKLK